jgi:transposase
MIPIPSGVRMWIATGHTDMRRGMNDLALQAQQALKRDPHAGDLFAFRGRRGQQATFYIQFSMCDDRLPLASPVWADTAGVSVPAGQGSEVHLHGRAA